MDIKSRIDNGELTIYALPERISSANFEELGAAITRIVGEQEHDALTLDFEGVIYIASAGLRTVMTCFKRHKGSKGGDSFRIVNVCPDVYDIFRTVGFSEMMKVERKKRSIDISNADIIGNGYFSRVYRTDPETVVKVFIRDTPLEEIEDELNLAKQAFIQGLDTPISFDIVEVHGVSDIEGKYGVAFELLDCDNLAEVLGPEDERFDPYVAKYVELLRKTNSTPAGDIKIPKTKSLFFEKLDYIRESLSKEELDNMSSLLDTVPDAGTLVHGDMQVKNVMCNKDELFIIDMATLSKGAPIFELGLLEVSYELFEELYPGNNQEFLGLSRQAVIKILDAVRGGFFERNGEYEDNLKKVRFVGLIHMAYWLKRYRPEGEREYAYILEHLKQISTEIKDCIVTIK